MSIPLIERQPRLERTANAAQTTLAAAVASTARPVLLTPASTAGWPTSPGFRIAVDNELMLITYVANSGATWLAETVEGSTAATHASGAAVTQILTAGALTQMIADHAGGSAAGTGYDPHPEYVRKGRMWSTGDWGIPTDGTDATGAIQNAIDTLAASGNGGTVWLPPGVMLVRGLVLKHGVWLRGMGMWASCLKLANGAEAAVITVQRSLTGTTANAEFTGVLDLRIDGNRYNQASQESLAGIRIEPNPALFYNGVDWDNDTHHLVQNVFIHDVAGVGLYTWGRSEGRFINVQCYFCNLHGFYCANDSFYLSCTSGQSGSHGFVVFQTGSVRLTQCKSWYAGRINRFGGYQGNRYNGAGFWIVSQSGTNLTGCEAQDNAGAGFFLESCNRATLSGCVADSNSVSGVGAFPGFHLYNSDFVTIAGGISFERMTDGTNSFQRNALRLEAGDDHNDITITHSGTPGATIGPAVDPVSVLTSSTIRVNGNDMGTQVVTYAAAITPDPYSGQYVVMTLTGAITINNPVTPYPGQQLTFVFLQDATGGRVVTWGTAFKVAWTPTTTGGRRNIIAFVYDSTSTSWIQTATAVGI